MISRKIAYLILAALCFFVYANSLNNAFVIDDIAAIPGNPDISRPLYFWQDPVRLLNYLGYLAGGYNPFAYHLTNILLHAAATLLVFLFLRAFFTYQAAFLGACLFAVHPVHTEAVAWISGRAYSILAVFIIAPYLLYRKATAAGTGEGKRMRYYLASVVLFFYFTIEHLPFYFVFPFFLLLSDICFDKWKEKLKWLAPFFAIVFFKLYLMHALISSRSSSMTTGMGFYTAKNPLTYFIYSFYAHLKLLLWPMELSLFHDPYVIPPSMFDWRSIFYVIPIVILLVIAFKRSKRIFFAICVFTMFLLPTYSPVPISSLVAERYLYFPSIALSMGAAFLYEKFSGEYAAFKGWFLAMFVMVAVLFAGRTMIRNRDWKDMRTVWESVLKVCPESWNAHDNMGFIYLDEGRPEDAARELEKALRVNPASAVTFNNLGIAYSRLGNSPKAVACFEKALELDPGYAKARNNLMREKDIKK